MLHRVAGGGRMTEHEKLVVLVEDDDSLRHALQRVLEAGGYCTRTYGSAEALLRAGLAVTADCLVLDIHLPGQSGLDLYAGLGRRRPPAIFISANDGASTREAALRSGAFAFLCKPVAAAELLESIARAVQQARRP
jgi:FixJ family two-component response regulator